MGHARTRVIRKVSVFCFCVIFCGILCCPILFVILTLRTSEAGIPALRKLPCGVGRRYTSFVQTSLWRRKLVFRRHGMSTPGVGRRYTGFVF